MENGRDASGVEAFVAFVIAFNKVMGMGAADRFSKDGIEIVVVEYKDVAHVSVGGYRESTWEVRANKTLEVFPRECIGAHFVVAVAMVLWWGECDIVEREWRYTLRGTNPLACAFHFPVTVGIDMGRCLQIRLLVRLGQVAEKPALIALQNVGIAG